MLDSHGLSSSSEATKQGARQGPSRLWHLVIAVLCLAFVIWLLMPEISHRHGPDTRRMRCMAALSAVSAGMHMYAADNDGAFPSMLGLLMGARKYVDPDRFIVSKPGLQLKGSACAYVCIGGQTIRDDPDNVLAYEPVSNHGSPGGNVVFVGGPVRFLDPGEHAAAIARTQARLATRPAMRPTTQEGVEQPRRAGHSESDL